VTALFDHLVGGGEQRLWHREAERFGGLEIDDQLELGRSHDRHVRMSALSALMIDHGIGRIAHRAGMIDHLSSDV
jgi:hypothetical protein